MDLVPFSPHHEMPKIQRAKFLLARMSGQDFHIEDKVKLFYRLFEKEWKKLRKDKKISPSSSLQEFSIFLMVSSVWGAVTY